LARGRRRNNRGRTTTFAALVVVVGLAGLGGIAYKVGHHKHGAAPPAGASQTGPAVGQPNPGQVVRDYFADINLHRYQAAWQLSGQHESLAKFTAGFAGTRHDAVAIIGTKGNVVTAALKAVQTDGSVKIYKGTYTVINGVITNPNVHLVRQTKPVTS